ncbi:YihY/virulence factor BrkB family protein [Ciceribacter sp. L1K22]|uniref:YihY/virulence factor BrkB family protein n=1 Tax=Ciceribacter sp. L1K22 TaxID=2820275 RepID=UPI001ABE378A|nr:YihY/virulence factor BrkB family protein [Ciceribacter sp. L1K22]MBO3758218.1 YihY/virulence factor BrkB family protein [Ciceribacter sp. L1K22]
MAANRSSTSEKDRGRDSTAPSEIPVRGLRDVFWRVVEQADRDRIALVSAGVSYYLLLALFPSLTALVSLYGFFADPSTISGHIESLRRILPPGSSEMIQEQLAALTRQGSPSLGVGFATGLAIGIWSARNGIMALFDAMNVAYNEREKRGLLELNLLVFAFTLGLFVLLGVITAGLAALPAVFAFVIPDSWLEPVLMILRWPILVLLVGFSISCLYRYGPSREPAKLRWLSWGAVISTAAWLLASLAFSYYLQNFGNYSATYGALGSVAGFMVWSWMCALIFILGAEINGELEHQTCHDTTTGEPRPMGERGAFVADTVGRAAD